MRPLNDKIIVQPDEREEKSAGGVILPDDMQQEQTAGKVIAVGPEVDGVAEGELVVYAKYGGTEIQYQGTKLLVIRQSDVVVVM